MSENPSLDNQELLNLEWIREYIKILNKKSNEKKIKLAEKIFFETYFENIQEGINRKVALQKAKSVAFCFLIENHK